MGDGCRHDSPLRCLDQAGDILSEGKDSRPRQAVGNDGGNDDCIKNKGNIQRLRRQNLSFRQVVDLTEQAVEAGFVTYIENKILLTGSGEAFLEAHITLTKKTNKAEWIEPDYKNKINPFPKNEVFLPDRNELSF